MKFYKGCESLSFFISTYVVFLLHIIFVYSVDDKSSEQLKETNKTLIMHKEIFSVLFIITFISHLITSLSDPGIIESENYLETLESYNYIYKEINQIKDKYNRRKRNEESDSSYSEESSKFSLSSEEDSEVALSNKNITITKKKQKIISEKYDFEINKCLRPAPSRSAWQFSDLHYLLHHSKVPVDTRHSQHFVFQPV